MRKLVTIFSFIIIFSGCSSTSQVEENEPKPILTGASQVNSYLSTLKDKNIALCVNHTSMIDGTHLYDSLENLGVKISRIFSPEHGFRGTADAGEKVIDGKVNETEIISLYGKNKKPSREHMAGIDIVVFDIQDVGARFYTYISTMHYIMEACAENNVELLILDRPNPNGSYIDGPILDTAYRSFVGMHPIPIVHGLTVGELGQMINGEGWLKDNLTCNLRVISLANWDHSKKYSLPVKPSPNLPNDLAIRLYPSLCLFEGTIVSVGRGTDKPFQLLGHPDYKKGTYKFIPAPNEGAKYPKLEGDTCRGINFMDSFPNHEFTLKYLIDFYASLGQDNNGKFFNDFFTLLAGTDELQRQIESGMTSEEIEKSWEEDHKNYLKMREKYLLYP